MARRSQPGACVGAREKNRGLGERASLAPEGSRWPTWFQARRRQSVQEASFPVVHDCAEDVGNADVVLSPRGGSVKAP